MSRPFLIGFAIAVLATFPLSAQEKTGVFDKAPLAFTIPWDADWCTAVTFAGSSRKLAAGNKLGQILVWDLPETPTNEVPVPARRLDGHTNAITALAATPDGRWLISTSYDHSIRLWDLTMPTTGKGSVLLQGSSEKKKKSDKVLELTVETQEASKVLTAHKEWVRGLSLDRDGKNFMTGDDSGLAILWELPEGKEIRRLQGKGWLRGVALSPDSSLAATCAFAPRYAGFPNALILWDADKGTVRRDLSPDFKRTGGQGFMGMEAAAISPDGKWLAVGQGGEVEGGTAKVFLVSLPDGKKSKELGGHQNGITALAFHPDGQHLASTGRDTVVRLWNLADGKQAAQFGQGRGGQFKDWLHAIAFSPDGKKLAAADMAGILHVWTFPTIVQPKNKDTK